MQEYLLDGDLNSGQSRLLAEADSFDLEDFYLDKLSSGGVCLITDNQEISENEYELLTTFSNRINQIVASNLDYFKTNPLLFEYYVRGGAVSTTEKNIKEVLECVKVKEVKNGKSI